MKKLLRVLLPPFVGFAIFFMAVRYSGLYFTLKFNEIGSCGLTGFMSYFRYALPLLFTDAVLTQLLITVPLYGYLKGKTMALKLSVGLDMFIVCLLFASLIGYAIYDETDSVLCLAKVITFLTGIQFLYWTINLLVLRCLS